MLLRASWKFFFVVSIAASALAFSGSARAQVLDDRWSQRRVAVHGIASLPGGPAGIFGAELDYAPVRWQGVNGAVGLGLGEHATEGMFSMALPRVSVGVRYRFLQSDGFAVSLGPTLSVGRSYRREFHFDDQDGRASIMEVPVAIWAGGQVAFEFRTEGGFSIKALVGLERMVNTISADCYDVSNSVSRPEARGTRLNDIPCGSVQPLGFDPWFPSTGVAAGYAF